MAMATSAQGDIRTTPHNLARKQLDGGPADARDVCVFCHTPVIGGQAGNGAIPKWQASVEPAYVFTLYDDIGRLGFDRQTIGSQSIACLSCHDANQALTVGRTSVDHPFGVPYRGALKWPVGRTVRRQLPQPREAPRNAARKLMALDDFRDASHGIIENRTAWWVSSVGVTASRSRTDLPLYPRIDEATGLEVPHIECSSCHDPHSPNESFLRIPGVAGTICLTCHTK